MINRPDSPSDLIFDSRVFVSTEQECLTSVECADTPVGRGTDRGAREERPDGQHGKASLVVHGSLLGIKKRRLGAGNRGRERGGLTRT